MTRRDLLFTSAGAVLFERNAAFSKPAGPVRRRQYEVTTSIEVLKPEGLTRVWAPIGLIAETPYQKTLENTVTCEVGLARTFEDRAEGLGVVAAEFRPGARPVFTVTSRVATTDWSVDLATRGRVRRDRPAGLETFLRATKYLPTDGIVKETAAEITKAATTDLDKARAIYDWIVENTYRNPKTRGCGLGDIRFMLESKDLGGKCADLNALYVGLARAAGLPARDVYGIRTAKSDLGYKSLGASSEHITKAQHCRAEVYLTDYGWVPVDPADVRKVMLEEPPGNRPPDDAMVTSARGRLFGSWEMNWMAYNFGHDVLLPGSGGAALPFLMYVQAETGGQRLDCLDPDNFRYEITSREIGPAKG
jgi:transglutaminase-like putative cysteine protease